MIPPKSGQSGGSMAFLSLLRIPRINHCHDLPIDLLMLDRREDRELCADLVYVQWNLESDSPRSEWAILEDISPSGACLEIEEYIPPETLVSLQFKSDHCQARIKYCKFDKTNYLLGVQFEQGYRWSRRRFKPEHLIQFRLRRVRKNK
jgi:hypothetical protein